MTPPNRSAFKRVCEELETQPLTLEQVGDVFGQPFWIMLVQTLLDAQDSARAVAGAINRLKAGGREDLDASVPDRSN